MSDQIKQQLREAYEYIKNGQRDQARAVLDPVVNSDPNNADAWWLMAMAVSTPADMRNALENVIRIKPDHANARQMLDKMNAQFFPSTPAASAPPTAPAPIPPTPAAPPPTPSAAPTQQIAPQPPSPVIPPAPALSSAPPTPPTPPAPTARPASGSQMGESLDDLFAPLPSAPAGPAAPRTTAPADDLFAPLPSASTGPAAPKSTFPEDDMFAPLPAGSPAPVYTPPPYNPATAQKGRNPIVYLLIALGIAAICVCGVCVGLPLLGGVAVLGDPTVQAGFSTAGAIIGTGVSLVQAPDSLPTNAKEQGSISANQSKTGRLGALDQHTWQYQGKSGESITIAAKTANSSSFDPYLGLYDADGNLIKRTQTGRTGSTLTLDVTLADDATYTILVGSIGGAPGSYTLTLSSNRQQSQ
ncbi:MAG: hypothetical protein IT324_14520 [Anaerolineae bacterium]|nr:hypothetical protein [Anaerolineae bacterium]